MNAIAQLIANLTPLDCEHYAASVAVLGTFVMKVGEVVNSDQIITYLVTDDGSVGLNRGTSTADYKCLYACHVDGVSLIKDSTIQDGERRAFEIFVVADKDNHIQLEVNASRIYPQKRSKRVFKHVFTFALQRPSTIDLLAFAEVLATNVQLFFSGQIDQPQFDKHPGLHNYAQRDYEINNTRRIQDVSLEQRLLDAMAADTPTEPGTH